MRTIIHIADLHFGKSEIALEKALKDVIKERSPDLIVVSGDITQRATLLQFQLAHEFFASLPYPILSVPGNHDIPLYSVWRRFFYPYALYRQYISKELEPRYEDEEILVIGINTVRILKAMEGRVNKKQIARVEANLAATSSNKIKIVVSHHPFNLPVGHRKIPTARAHLFWKKLLGAGVDLILSGHLHDTLDFYLDKAYQISTPGPILIQSGTTISTRRRKEENSFNIIILTAGNITIDRYEYNQDKKVFVVKKIEHFVQKDKTWMRDPDQITSQ
ncbi:MAG TPA: metallophosphoesterase [Patescibacteria group bacterium]